MAIQIKCCKFTGDPRLINKTPTTVANIECRIVNEQDTMNPVIYINNDNIVIHCNYFVIGFRKYFKVKETRVSGNRVKVQLHQDVLSTWMPKINIRGTVSRATRTPLSLNEDLYQDYTMEVKKRISRIKINNNYGDVTSRPAIIVQSPLPVAYMGLPQEEDQHADE